MEFAARNNYHVAQNLDTDQIVAKKFDLYREKWLEAGHKGKMARVFLMRQVHVAETDEKAHEEARQFIASREGGAVPVGGGPVGNTRIGWGTHLRGMGMDSERFDDKRRGDVMKAARKSYEFNLDEGLALVGSPETVIKKLQEGQIKIGYDIFCTNHDIGKMPLHMVNNSISLFGKEVIPAFEGTLGCDAA